jgi:hypothetical protein
MLLVCVGAVGAHAQSDTAFNYPRDMGFGLRTGFTNWGSVSQLHVGAHLKMGELFPGVYFTPNIEAGFGDNLTLIALNGDLAYSFTELVAFPWNLSAGGSLGFYYLDPKFGDTDTQLGVSALVGLERTLANDHQVLLEFRVGVMDSPDYKITVGYTLF